MLLAAAEGSEEARVYLETEAPYVLENCKDSNLLRQIRQFEELASKNQ